MKGLADMGECMLSTEHLSVGYGEKIVIEDINISLEKGKILAVIGPNGSGKSTLLRTLTKGLKPLGGRAYICGDEIGQIKADEMAKRVAIVFTGKPNTEFMTCREVVETGRYPYTGRMGVLGSEDKRIAEDAMEIFHVTEIADDDFMKISDGQRQRVMIARALCQEPDIIVLDEPTTFLDIHYKLELLGLLKGLAKEKGIAILISIHELELAKRLADDVLCVKNKSVFKYGNVDDVMRGEVLEELFDLEKGALGGEVD